MQFLDIIIFAVIAVLLVLRLKSVLGQRTGYEQSQEESGANQFREKNENDNRPIPLHPDGSNGVTVVEEGIEALRSMDKEFDEKKFISGAEMAYGLILEAYADGNNAKLKQLLGFELYESFSESIQARLSANEKLSISVDEIKDIEIQNVKVIDKFATIKIRFHSLQTRVVYDEQGKPIDPEETISMDFIDIWTFERDLSHPDPNWKLIETETPEDEEQ